jgi:NAD(P)-dependent dehydrogenase (short-subunit alcohol dehydrogenase family)
MEPRTLDNKCVVIIGGTSGLGLAGALACQRAGAHVVVVGLSDKALESARDTLGADVAVLAGDATDATTAPSAIAAAQERFGRFDALYHVAGGSGRRWGDGPLHELSDDGLEKTMALNFNSLAYSNRAALQAFRAQGSGGTILNMASVLADAPSPHHFSTHIYAAAKAAVVGLTKSSAAYYAPDNIRINAIAPGLTDTPMAGRAKSDDAIQQFIKTKQPLDGGRMGAPDDLDSAVTFLLSDSARFVTGQVLGVDGGWSVSEGQFM